MSVEQSALFSPRAGAFFEPASKSGSFLSTNGTKHSIVQILEAQLGPYQFNNGMTDPELYIEPIDVENG
jgi:hypothetical protein